MADRGPTIINTGRGGGGGGGWAVAVILAVVVIIGGFWLLGGFGGSGGGEGDVDVSIEAPDVPDVDVETAPAE